MVIIVAGFGRCGSSMVMQMLAMGGLKCAGEWPSYEPEEVREGMNGSPITSEWIEQFDAVKILDPQLTPLPQGDYKVVWLERNHVEQAKSALKFMRLVAGMRLPNDDHAIKTLAESYRKDKPAACQALQESGATDFLPITFEDVLQHPAATGTVLADYCGIDLRKSEDMAAAVHPRSLQCAGGLDMETMLMDQGMPTLTGGR